MVSEAYLLSQDKAWLAEHVEAVQQTLAFYELYTGEAGLVHEKPFGNWEDSLLYDGPRAFTNLSNGRSAQTLCSNAPPKASVRTSVPVLNPPLGPAA